MVPAVVVRLLLRADGAGTRRVPISWMAQEGAVLSPVRAVVAAVIATRVRPGMTGSFALTASTGSLTQCPTMSCWSRTRARLLVLSADTSSDCTLPSCVEVAGNPGAPTWRVPAAVSWLLRRSAAGRVALHKADRTRNGLHGSWQQRAPPARSPSDSTFCVPPGRAAP